MKKFLLVLFIFVSSISFGQEYVVEETTYPDYSTRITRFYGSYYGFGYYDYCYTYNYHLFSIGPISFFWGNYWDYNGWNHHWNSYGYWNGYHGYWGSRHNNYWNGYNNGYQDGYNAGGYSNNSYYGPRKTMSEPRQEVKSFNEPRAISLSDKPKFNTPRNQYFPPKQSNSETPKSNYNTNTQTNTYSQPKTFNAPKTRPIPQTSAVPRGEYSQPKFNNQSAPKSGNGYSPPRPKINGGVQFNPPKEFTKKKTR